MIMNFRRSFWRMFDAIFERVSSFTASFLLSPLPNSATKVANRKLYLRIRHGNHTVSCPNFRIRLRQFQYLQLVPFEGSCICYQIWSIAGVWYVNHTPFLPEHYTEINCKLKLKDITSLMGQPHRRSGSAACCKSSERASGASAQVPPSIPGPIHPHLRGRRHFAAQHHSVKTTGASFC